MQSCRLVCAQQVWAVSVLVLSACDRCDGACGDGCWSCVAVVYNDVVPMA